MDQERIAIMMIENDWPEEEAIKWYELNLLDTYLHDFLAGLEIDCEFHYD